MKTFLEIIACTLLLLGPVGCNSNCQQDDYDTVATQADGTVVTTSHHCDGHGHCYVTTTATAPAAPTPVTIPPAFQTPAPVVAPAGDTPPSQVAAAGGGIKRAVICGINVYSDPSAPGLSGCVNDAKNIKAKAIASWGFKESDIVLLLDKDATIAAVKKALTDAVSASKPGDTLLYWQSSHGADDTIADDNGAEVHQLACMTDFGWDRAHEMCDVDFFAIFSKLPEGVTFRWSADECHSGMLDRLVEKHKKPIKIKSAIPPEHVRIRVAKARINGAKTRSLHGPLLNVGFIAGCGKDQTSADSTDDSGNPAGAETAEFLKICDAFSDKPITELVKQMDADLAAQQYDQIPEADGKQANQPWMPK